MALAFFSFRWYAKLLYRYLLYSVTTEEILCSCVPFIHSPTNTRTFCEALLKGKSLNGRISISVLRSPSVSLFYHEGFIMVQLPNQKKDNELVLLER